LTHNQILSSQRFLPFSLGLSLSAIPQCIGGIGAVVTGKSAELVQHPSLFALSGLLFEVSLVIDFLTFKSTFISSPLYSESIEGVHRNRGLFRVDFYFEAMNPFGVLLL
jgi:hypothetical protein